MRLDGCLVACIFAMALILIAIYLIASHPEWGL